MSNNSITAQSKWARHENVEQLTDAWVCMHACIPKGVDTGPKVESVKVTQSILNLWTKSQQFRL